MPICHIVPYKLIEILPHIDRFGRPTSVLYRRGWCRVCHRPFECTTSRRPPKYMPRTCPEHRPWEAKPQKPRMDEAAREVALVRQEIARRIATDTGVTELMDLFPGGWAYDRDSDIWITPDRKEGRKGPRFFLVRRDGSWSRIKVTPEGRMQ